MEEHACIMCGRAADFYSPYLKQHLCKKHFEKMMMRRISKIVVSSGLKNRTYKFSDDGSDAYRMLDFTFRLDGSSKTRLNNGTLEDFAVEILRYFTEKRYRPKIKIKGKDFINPLYTTSESEIADFLGAKNIKTTAKKRSEKERWLIGFLYDLEKRRPGGLISIVKIGARIGII